ncbi:alpha/beta hydrolase [Haloferax sp. Atlit-12N]|uniref:alpha/beta fold hydrolase n=1 Tax=Haloferax sp. Atlit-12N TaxID=2077203 RepID=UPI000E25A036|nr:alpha/beta hydrolase [Haloferax sp. Atlit-12N]RDZ63863.1 alpha/beta hydrolase [Haloferax sp. Atlit-12N]
MSIYRSSNGRRAVEQVYTEAVEELAFDVDETYVETRHGETHVLIAGPADGQPVIVFHGGNATNPLTLGWYSGLTDEYRLIAPDTIGQPGRSAETRVAPNGDGYGEWVVDLLDAFDLDAVPMIGTSYGGGIVLRTAAYAPARITRAGLVVPAGFGTGGLVSMLNVGIPALLYRFLGRDWLLAHALNAMGTQADSDPLVRATVGASLRYVDLEREFPSATADELEEFTAPVALFAAANDPFFPAPAIVPRARARLSNLSKTEVLDDEKHLLSPAGQEAVTSSLLAFLSE